MSYPEEVWGYLIIYVRCFGRSHSFELQSTWGCFGLSLIEFGCSDRAKTGHIRGIMDEDCLAGGAEI